MADCAQHPGRPGTSTCRVCSRAVCDECRRDVRGTAYCEDCLAARVSPPAESADGQPNPTLAAFLGVLPGVGAFYNGQYEKGVLHVLLFPMLLGMAEASHGFLAILIPFYFGYLVIDAYQTALAKQRGAPLPDYLAFGALFGSAERPLSGAFGRLSEAGTPAAAVPAAGEATRPPIAALALIALGVFLLFGNMGWIPSNFIRTFWPVALIVIGIVQGRRRWIGRD